MLMERSMALKSPSIHYHLAGTKKVQQELAKPGQLERFLGDKAELIEQVVICTDFINTPFIVTVLTRTFYEQIRGVFTGLYSLDHDENGDKSFKRAMDNPSGYCWNI